MWHQQTNTEMDQNLIHHGPTAWTKAHVAATLPMWRSACHSVNSNNDDDDEDDDDDDDNNKNKKNKKEQKEGKQTESVFWYLSLILVGGWATPLKNMVRQLGWLATQYMGK